jgi:hypothetical protein
MNHVLHNNPTQQPVHIDSLGAPILERSQGYPGGLVQGHPPIQEESPKEVRWSSHGVYYRTPYSSYEKTLIWVTPETKKLNGEIDKKMFQRLVMCFIYVWCFWLIIVGVFYYAGAIEMNTALVIIAIITLLLMIVYMQTKR